MNADHRRLSRLREGQGDVANHVIDEFAAGRMSRRDFIRRGSVVGISLPLLGAVVSACGSTGSSSSPSTSAGKAGATIKVGIVTPTAAINPLTVADQGGLDMLAQTGEYLCLSTQTLVLKPVLAESWSANSTADVWRLIWDRVRASGRSRRCGASRRGGWFRWWGSTSAQEAQERGFAAAVRADQADSASRSDDEAEAVE